MHSAYVLLVDQAPLRVAVVNDGGSLSLPRVVSLDSEPVDIVKALAHDETGGERPGARWLSGLSPLTVLTCLAEVEDTVDDVRSTTSLYLCEPSAGSSLAEAVDGWWTTDDPDLTELPAALAAAVRFTLAILHDGDAADGPWSFFNLPGATAALADLLASVPAAAAVATMRGASPQDHGGDTRPTDLRQVRGWWLSSVWQNDEVVLKVTHPSWPGEPTITELLNRSVPEHVEELVTSGTVTVSGHRPTPWMLQRRVDGPAAAPRAEADQDAAERQRLSLSCAAALARIQLTFQDRGAELLAAGAVDRSLEWTRSALPRLWATPELAALESAERDALPVLESSINERLDALTALGATALLAHGDLHLGNVIEATSGELKLIDWTDAALTWPGVDLLTFLPRRQDAERREEVIAAYEAALGPRHGRCVRPGLDLADVYHAISYALIDEFLPRSARWELGGTVLSLVKRQLERVMR